MRILAIGDIHGCRRALQTLLELVDVTPRDILITLGDMVDRGPDSKGVIDDLLSLQKTGRLIHLRGNHEVMMLTTRNHPSSAASWKMVGGRETLASYGSGSLDDVPEAHWEFLESSLPIYEIDTHFFVHAGVDPDLALADQPESELYWSRFFHPSLHHSGKQMVCGHTPQETGIPRVAPGGICIDTYAYAKYGWLTCLDVEGETFYQANESGETRSGNLLDLAA